MSKQDPVIVVNEQDEILESIPRWQADRDGLRYRVSGVWIENRRGEVLIAQRGLNKMNEPGLWGVAAAGTVEVGQSYLENAQQEVREELGITDIKLEEARKFSFTSGIQKRFVTLFKGTTDTPIDDLKIEFPEVNAVKWIDKRTLFIDIAKNPDSYIEDAENYENYFGS